MSHVRYWSTWGARVIGAAYFVATSIYCLLYFMPFTYVQLLESELVPALVLFERTHAWLFLPAVGLLDLSVRRVSLPARAHTLYLGWRLVLLVIGFGVLVRPVLPRLEHDVVSFAWSQLALLPPLVFVGFDFISARAQLCWARSPTRGEHRPLIAAGLAAIVCWLVVAASAVTRPGVWDGLTTTELAVAVAWSLAAHLVLFFVFCSGLLLVRGIADLTARPVLVEVVGLTVLSIPPLAWFINRSVFAGLAFSGPAADTAAVTLAMTLVMTGIGLSVRTSLERAEKVGDGISMLFRPIVPCAEGSRIAGGLWLAALAAIVWLLSAPLAEVDWNYLLQRMLVLTLWVVVFGVCHAALRPRPHAYGGIVASFVAPLLALGLFVNVGPATASLLGATAHSQTLPGVLERYTGYDAAAGLLDSWLTPRTTDAEDQGALFRYLQRHTGIPRSVQLGAPHVRFVDEPSAPATVRPHIFVIVVDSLRRDYLGVYNSAVNFTPSIDRFAQESVVFKQALTRYGATGLSEPSIWVGGMIPHQQYVSPFAPMNALQTLLKAQGYQGLVTVDPILDKIIDTKGWVTALDKGRRAGDIELCQTLDELTGHLSTRTDSHTPVFMYTQPQNIHIATIGRGGRTPVDDRSYDGFFAPYASRLRHLDACFGRFVDYLKTEGLYDSSVVILTSDHGDSLGEGGRYGHAYTIFPEILRIPLIMHVPAGLLGELGIDPGGLAFSTDLTPTLYRLMGLDPAPLGSGFGRSLFTRRVDERRDYVTADHLVASSYGPVYGLLSDEGRSLYILDAVNYRDYLYDLTTDSNTASQVVSSILRRSAGTRIRELIAELHSWYGVPRLD